MWIVASTDGVFNLSSLILNRMQSIKIQSSFNALAICFCGSAGLLVSHESWLIHVQENIKNFYLFTWDTIPLRHWRASFATTLRSAGSALHNHCLAVTGCFSVRGQEPSRWRRPSRGCSNVSGSEHSTMLLRPRNSVDAAATSSSDICTYSS